VLVPGLVDAHTHPVFAGERVHEFAMKLAGATYMQVRIGVCAAPVRCPDSCNGWWDSLDSPCNARRNRATTAR
jgi:predicted amidohydrolase YtcJ